MSYKHFILYLILVAGSSHGFCQTAGQYIAKGDQELKDGYPQSALFYYRKALRLDTNIPEANFKAGEAYRVMRYYKRAAAFYRATAEVDGEDKFLEALYWLGVMQKQMGEYKEAKRSFQYFLSVYKQRDDFYRSARDHEASCDWAIDHQGDEPKFKVTDPDSGLNTIHAEMSPFLVDSNTMYFATMRYESDIVKKSSPVFVEIKKALKDTSGWQMAELDLPVSDKNAHIGNGCFSADSSRFYFSKCPTPAECKINMIRKTGGSWGEPEEMEAPVNEGGSLSTQPALTTLNGNEYLFFVSDRESGKGGMDLWCAELKKGEPTTRVRNLGTRVNTKGDEITPWYDAHDSTLYFSSNQQLGFGGFDIFKSKGEPGSFNLVENLGTGINSPADDYYFMFRRQDSLGYFASNRITGLKEGGNETCCNDLYKARITPVPDTLPSPIDTIPQDTVETDTAIVAADTFEVPETIEQLQQLLPISLYFHNDRPNPRSVATTTTRDYLQTIYEYLALEDEYMKAIESSATNPEEKTLLKSEISSFFKHDLEKSVEQLDMAMNVLLVELERGSKIELAVKGYASPLANSDYNLNLTYRRINAMENYIRTYQDGAFLPYLDLPEESTDKGRLIITKIPYGETQAASDVSDDLNDKLGAIYSPKAIFERRIEILRVERQ